MDKAAAEAIFRPAAVEALGAFGVPAAELSFVSLSENATFRATDARDGRALTLRLHRSWYHDLEELESERAWIRALAAAGIAVPEPMPTLSGQDYASVRIEASGETRWAGMARWIDGEILAGIVEAEPDISRNAAHFRGLGALMARLHAHADAWKPPPSFKRRAVDADGLMGPSPHWGQFWSHPVLSPAERALLLAVRAQLHDSLTRYGKNRSSFCLIHADLHPGNVLIAPAGAAVIDFDDAAFGWRIYDFAVALVGYQNHPGYEAFREALFQGYETVMPTPERSAELLPMFMLIRNLAQIGWLGQRPEFSPGPRLIELRDIACAAAAAFSPPV